MRVFYDIFTEPAFEFQNGRNISGLELFKNQNVAKRDEGIYAIPAQVTEVKTEFAIFLLKVILSATVVGECRIVVNVLLVCPYPRY